METETKRKRGAPGGHTEATKLDMQRIIDFVKWFHNENRYAPTLTEIAIGLGRPAGDFGQIQRLTRELIAEGFLVSAGYHQSRSLALPKKLPRKYYYKPSKSQVDL